MSTNTPLIAVFDIVSGRYFSTHVLPEIEPDAEIVEFKTALQAQQFLEKKQQLPDIYVINAPRLPERKHGKAVLYPSDAVEQAADIIAAHLRHSNTPPEIYMMFNFAVGNAEAHEAIKLKTGIIPKHLKPQLPLNDTSGLKNYVAEIK